MTTWDHTHHISLQLTPQTSFFFACLKSLPPQSDEKYWLKQCAKVGGGCNCSLPPPSATEAMLATFPRRALVTDGLCISTVPGGEKKRQVNFQFGNDYTLPSRWSWSGGKRRLFKGCNLYANKLISQPGFGLNCIIVSGNWLMLYVQCETSRLSVLAPQGLQNPLQPYIGLWSHAKRVNIFKWACRGEGRGYIHTSAIS